LDSSDSCIEIRDSELILDSMKNRMRSLLNKYKNGILCDAFMEVYGVSITYYKTIFVNLKTSIIVDISTIYKSVFIYEIYLLITLVIDISQLVNVN
jgi:hypothetical protein